MIVVLGVAGSGKSTQCRRLAENGGFRWESIGKILRDRNGGVGTREMMIGQVLSDDTICPILEEVIAGGDSPEVLLDGAPRNVSQAHWLVNNDHAAIRAVLHIVIGEEVAIARLQSRKRVDDTIDAIIERIAGYNRDIEPVLSEFRIKSIPVITINGSLDEDLVHQSIVELIGALESSRQS